MLIVCGKHTPHEGGMEPGTARFRPAHKPWALSPKPCHSGKYLMARLRARACRRSRFWRRECCGSTRIPQTPTLKGRTVDISGNIPGLILIYIGPGLCRRRRGCARHNIAAAGAIGSLAIYWDFFEIWGRKWAHGGPGGVLKGSWRP